MPNEMETMFEIRSFIYPNDHLSKGAMQHDRS